MYLLIVNSAGYNPPEKSDNLAKAKKKVVPLQAKSSRLWDDTVNLMPHLRKSDNRCPSRKRVIKLISDQVWSTDISYVPLEHGFMYLYAMIDVYSRYVLGWRLSNTLSARNCYELLQECIEQHGAPEILNTDQGSQYTTAEWEQLLTDNHIRISMDGRGRCKDNIWIERFWRTIKQEHIYLHPTDDVRTLRLGIGDWIKFCNEQLPHQSLQGSSPARMFRKAT